MKLLLFRIFNLMLILILCIGLLSLASFAQSTKLLPSQNLAVQKSEPVETTPWYHDALILLVGPGSKKQLPEGKNLNDGKGPDDPLNLIIEVTGERRAEKEIKAATARNQWVPAVNNHGSFGRWVFVEILDPWDAENILRAEYQKYMENK